MPKFLFGCMVLVALTSCAIAEAAEPAITPAPTLPQKRATSCTFSGTNGASLASISQKACSTMILSNVEVPSGKTLDLGNLPDDTTVIFDAETTWDYEEWNGPLLLISGTNITVEGTSGARLNAGGARWWDGHGSNGGKKKPKFFYAHDLVLSSITNLYIQNTPVQAVSINGCKGLTVTNMTINSSAGDTEGGHNTDGFDIGSSSNVTITGANVYNQDDCVAVNSGTDITFSGGVCSGGHGLSIGSVGGRVDNIVDTVNFEHSEVQRSVNGIRIKATKGDTGTITGVTYSQIILEDISGYGILIEQNYDGGDLDGGTPSSGIPITGLTVEHITGSGAVDSSGYNIVIACGSGACSDWTWENVVVTGGKDYSLCSNVPSVASCST